MIQSNIHKPKSALDWLLLSLLIFIPRLLNLDVFLTADETLFLQHARAFADGLATGDWSRTLGIGYPGVTVAWWSTPVVGLATTELGAYTAGRLVTAAATGLLLLLLFGLVRPLLGRWPALLGIGLLALDPYTLSYSRLFHIEATLVLFMTLAGVVTVHWLRDDRWRWPLLAGVFTGLALLTKSTALLLGPMLIAMIIGWGIVTRQGLKGRWWLMKLVGVIVITLVACLIFYMGWPAMWVQPAEALDLTLSKLLTDQEAGAGNLGLFWFGKFVEDPGPAFYPVAFLLKATPGLFIGLGLSLWQVVRSQVAGGKVAGRRSQDRKDVRKTSSPISNPPSPQFPITLSFWLFALTYLLIMTIASKKSIRYLLPAFPTFYLLTGMAFWSVIAGVKETGSKVAGRRSQSGQDAKIFNRPSPPLPLSPSPISNLQSLISHTPKLWLLSTLLALAILLLPFYHPYYLTYYNPLLLGWRWAPQTLLVGWGEGLDQAAAYLNEQPEVTVSAWYEWLFPLLYRGPVEAVVPQENLLTAEKSVLYINQVQRDIPGPNIIDYFQTRRRPEYTVHLAGIDYAWVYPGPIVSVEHPDPTPQITLGGDFGGEVRLLGYDLHPEPRSGEPLIVTLYWRVLTPPPGDRFVYVRLVDQQGHVWASTDSPPVMGLWPIERWQPDMLIEDAQALLIPAGTPPGTYRLEIGFYDPVSGQPLAASGQPLGQGGGLLLGEVPLTWQSLSVEANLAQQTQARLAPNALLIGYTVPLTSATTGDLLPIQLAWREAATFIAWLSAQSGNDLVMFEWRQGDQVLAEQLDSLPFPIDQWGDGALLRSQHDVIVPPTLATDSYDLWVMLHNGSDPAGQAFRLGAVDVTAPPHNFELPSQLTVLADGQLSAGVAVRGYEINIADETLTAILYWQTTESLTTRYKVFVQLLDPANVVVAQSDAFPATGERPTTGWLSKEIIADTHTLTLPPDLSAGSYRLIAGLYDPLTGERLPHLDSQGQVIDDFFVVAEVALP